MINESISKEINKFINLWDCNQMIAFFKQIYPLIELFEVTGKNDWVRDEVGEENAQNVRVLKMVYILSKIADMHAGRLCRIKIEHKNLWKRLEEIEKETTLGDV